MFDIVGMSNNCRTYSLEKNLSNLESDLGSINNLNESFRFESIRISSY